MLGTAAATANAASAATAGMSGMPSMADAAVAANFGCWGKNFGSTAAYGSSLTPLTGLPASASPAFPALAYGGSGSGSLHNISGHGGGAVKKRKSCPVPQEKKDNVGGWCWVASEITLMVVVGFPGLPRAATEEQRLCSTVAGDPPCQGGGYPEEVGSFPFSRQFQFPLTPAPSPQMPLPGAGMPAPAGREPPTDGAVGQCQAVQPAGGRAATAIEQPGRGLHCL